MIVYVTLSWFQLLANSHREKSVVSADNRIHVFVHFCGICSFNVFLQCLYKGVSVMPSGLSAAVDVSSLSYPLPIIAGQSSLTAVSPINVKVVDTPHDELSSATPVCSLIPKARRTTVVPNPIIRGHPYPQVMEVARDKSQFSRPGRAYSESELIHSSKDDISASTESLPTSATCIPGHPPSFSSPSVLGIPSRTVQVEGVDETCDEEDLVLAFNNEDKGGGEIEEHGIVLKGSTAYITFKNPTGENMKTIKFI